MITKLTPEIIISAYREGLFPMAEQKDSKRVIWMSPAKRGIIPLSNFHISKSLRRIILKERYQIKVNTNFPLVMTNCANRKETWINLEIFNCYNNLFNKGFCHSVEVWEEQELVGGIYGVALNRVFFGESMFSKKSNTSKIAMAYLVARLKYGGFSLFDVQFLTEHLRTLGAIEIMKSSYLDLLQSALKGEANFLLLSHQVTPQKICI